MPTKRVFDRLEFEPRLEQSRQRLARLNEQIEAIHREQNEEQNLRFVVSQLESFAQMVEGSPKQADWTTKREIIRALVKHIGIDQESVKIAYRVNDLPFAQAPEKGSSQHCSERLCALASMHLGT